MEWTKKWPTKSGWYWFYGYLYGKKTESNQNGDENPSLHPVRVDADDDGKNAMRVTEGQFLYETDDYGDKTIGKFIKADLPELPDLEEE